MEPLLWILVVVVVGVIGGRLTRQQQAENASRVAFLARQWGLAYSARDPYGVGTLPFRLLAARHGTVSDVISGDLRGMPVIAFDLALSESPTVTCAMTMLPFQAPQLTIQHKPRILPGFAETRALASTGGASVVGTESTEFDDAYRVACEDARFASALLAPPMMQWLLAEAGPSNFELSGHRLLLYAERVRPPHLGEFLEVLRGFRDRIPPVAAEMLPASSAPAGVATLAATAFEPRPPHRWTPMDVVRMVVIVATIAMFIGMIVVMIGVVVAMATCKSGCAL